MELKNLLDLKKGCLISIVGAGGKSTLMFTLAQEMRKDNKCLVTTTTKIYSPQKEQFDFIAVGYEELNRLKHNSNYGIYVYGSNVTKDNKLIGISCNDLEEASYYFDYILVEADGSKMKPIKGWKDTEPVVCRSTTNTVGILSIESLGKQINENNVHRVEEFISLTNAGKNEIISIDNYISLIFHPKGIFKNSLGEKILFINKVESNDQWRVAENLLHCIEDRNNELLLINKIILGSLKNKNFKVIVLNK